MTPKRDHLIDHFLQRCGWDDAQRMFLAGDASFRSYDRLSGPNRSIVLMDAPPPEDIRPFVAVAHWLRQHGFLAPQIHAMDFEAGLLLLEDLGDTTFLRAVVTDPALQTELYQAAIETLVELHRYPAPNQMPLPDGTHYDLPVYDTPALMAGAGLFTQWYLPALTGRSSQTGQQAFANCLHPLLKMVIPTEPVIGLRDYHAENLMWLPDYPKGNHVGLLDFQDASRSHPAYDLVSLLQDARRDVPPKLEQEMIDSYLSLRTQAERPLDPDHFRRDYAILGAQRNLRILGVFTRLAKRDGKLRYLDFMPRVWGLLERCLTAEPLLAELKEWIDSVAPVGTRDLSIDRIA